LLLPTAVLLHTNYVAKSLIR